MFQEVCSIRLTYNGVSVFSPQPPTSRRIPKQGSRALQGADSREVAGPGAGSREGEMNLPGVLRLQLCDTRRLGKRWILSLELMRTVTLL